MMTETLDRLKFFIKIRGRDTLWFPLPPLEVLSFQSKSGQSLECVAEIHHNSPSNGFNRDKA